LQRRPRTDLQLAEGWLRCVDCLAPYLQQLVQLPQDRQDTVARFFASVLFTGPDSASRAQHDRYLIRMWEANSTSVTQRGVPLHGTRVSFLGRYRRNFQVTWRSRAATALGVLRTDGAITALDSATTVSFDSIAPGDSAIIRAIFRARADTGRSILDSFP